jgi:hypothetical protein
VPKVRFGFRSVEKARYRSPLKIVSPSAASLLHEMFIDLGQIGVQLVADTPLTAIREKRQLKVLR